MSRLVPTHQQCISAAVRKTVDHALDEISRQWELLKRIYGSVTSDSDSAIFSPRKTNSNTTWSCAVSRGTRNFKKSCPFVITKKTKRNPTWIMTRSPQASRLKTLTFPSKLILKERRRATFDNVWFLRFSVLKVIPHNCIAYLYCPEF